MSNRYIFHKKYFIKLFIIIFIISLLAISIYSFAAFNFYSVNLSEEQKTNVISSLNRAAQNSDSLLKEIDMLYTLIFSNSVIRNFLNAYGTSTPEEGKIVEYIQDFQQFNICVESIAMYNLNINQYIDDNTGGPDMRLFLGTYLNDLQNYGTTNNLSRPKNLFFYRPTESDKKLLSIIYYDIKPNENICSCIAINLNVDKVSNYLFQDIDGISILANEFGSVVCSSSTSEDSTDVAYRNRWTQRLSTEQKITGIFNDTIDGNKIVVSFYKLSEYGWHLFHASKEISFHLLSTGNLKYLLLVIWADILFSAAIAYFFSLKLYSPVNDIIRQLTTKYLDISDSSSGNDEFRYVNDIFSTLSNRITVLETENTNFLLSIKEDFLRRILDNSEPSDNAEAEWNLYSVKVVPENLIIVVIKKDNLENTNRNEKVFVNLIVGSANHLLKGSFNIETVITKTDEITLLLNMNNQCEDSFEFIVASLENLRSFIHSTTGISISIGIGGIANSIEECAIYYKQALEMIKQRFVIGYGKIVYQEYIKAALSTGLEYPDELISELLINIRNTNKDLFLENYDKLLGLLKRFVYRDVAAVLFQVITQCLHEMNSILINNSLLQISFDEFNTIFNNLHTLDHSRSWFSNLFDEYTLAIRKLEQLKSDRHDQLVETMKKYIDDHYFDPGLSVDSLAESAGYTANYFSKIFKKTTGYYLRDYIKLIRIAHAKELLKNTSLTIHEISEMTGFINQKYFFPIFKNEIGLTPTMYRNKWMSKQIVNK